MPTPPPQDRISAPITKMSVAPNGHFLACYRRDGVITVLSAAFTSKVLDFNTKSMSRPMEIAWCGDDAVVLLWRNTGAGTYSWSNGIMWYRGLNVMHELVSCLVSSVMSYMLWCEHVQYSPCITLFIN